ncbi:MAG: FkbM family methyltransferase [Pyrinomonadaceae bacterium]|nr:FkbM family methyltransferase [Pyrinomonadaceae bacterium]MBP6212765.1 FkbM family methyltransferase [Pyrinomonadaceae bacterium]
MSLHNKIKGLREVWAFDNRLWLAFTKILFPGENLHVYRYKGLDILTDHLGGDSNGARDVLTSEMYRRYIPRMKLTGPANILDLGANNGGFPLLLASCGVSMKKVVSVEFNPQTYTRLHFNLTRNLECEVIPLNAALCGESTNLELSLGNGSVSDSIYSESKSSDLKLYKIQGMTLDDLYNTYFKDEVIDICKIDVEEAEFDVFLNPSHQSLKQCRYVIMEIHERNGRRSEEIVPIIESLGFERRAPDPDGDPSVHFFSNSIVFEQKPC